MNLWIRSQDKKILLNPIFIEYDRKTVENKTNLYCGIHKIITFYNGIQYILGEYETQKRALQILDEIQKIKSIEVNDYVYEMPKE